MHLIDRHAYTNRLRPVDPLQKAAIAITALLLCLVLNRTLVGLVALGWMLGLMLGWARLAPRVVANVLLGEAFFLLLAVVGVAVNLSLDQPAATWRWQIGPVWFFSSPEAIATTLLLLTRALGCAAAMSFLALTTPLVDLIDLLRRLRVPELLIDLMTLMYRFIFTLLESLERMRTAQESRLGYHGWMNSMRSAAVLGSRLFIDAYQRSKRLASALDARGYAGGALVVLPSEYRTEPRLWWVNIAMAITMVIAWSLG